MRVREALDVTLTVEEEFQEADDNPDAHADVVAPGSSARRRSTSTWSATLKCGLARSRSGLRLAHDHLDPR